MMKVYGKVKVKRKYYYRGFLWLAPAVLLLALFCLYPSVYAMALSFTNYGERTFKIVFFENLSEIFAAQIFWKGMLNIVILTVWGLFVGIAGSVLLAEMFFRLKYEKLGNALRFLYILPTLVPGVVGMLIWQKIIFTPAETGLANALLRLFGAEPLGWYYDEYHRFVPMLSLLLTGFPFVGGCNFLIYLAGLNNIAEGISDAAKLDGVNTWQSVWYIDLPCMMGQVKYSVITGIISGIQGYGTQLLFTKGGPNYATTVPGYYMYTHAFDLGQYGYASAVGMILFFIILILTVLNMKFINRKDEEEVQ